MRSYFQGMPEPYLPKTRDYPLSNLNQARQMVRVRCSYCKRTHNYFPSDLIQIFGDVAVDSLIRRMKCEDCSSPGSIRVEAFSPTGSEAVGLRVRRLVAIKIQRIPVWRDG
jgi:hypothetical protein